MSPQSEPSTQEVLAGLAKPGTYYKAEKGFCLLRGRARGQRDDVTVAMPQPFPPTNGSEAPANGSTTSPTASSSRRGSCAISWAHARSTGLCPRPVGCVSVEVGEGSRVLDRAQARARERHRHRRGSLKVL